MKQLFASLFSMMESEVNGIGSKSFGIYMIVVCLHHIGDYTMHHLRRRFLPFPLLLACSSFFQFICSTNTVEKKTIQIYKYIIE